MPLRKTASLTPQQLDANRGNAQRSTGPRSQAGKERMKMNALKHGCDALPENDAAVKRALGEDSEKFQALQQELADDYGPGDALWARQVDDLARLYWRCGRLERLQTAPMRQALAAVEEEQRGLARDLAGATFEPVRGAQAALTLPRPDHPLKEQMAEEKAEFEADRQAEERQAAMQREACLEPQGKTWETLLDQEARLDRSIDRKVKILLAMRKEQARLDRDNSRVAPTSISMSAPPPKISRTTWVARGPCPSDSATLPPGRAGRCLRPRRDPYPTRSGWRKCRPETPSPHGRGQSFGDGSFDLGQSRSTENRRNKAGML